MTNLEELDVLRRGLDQAAALLESVQEDELAEPTPCSEWSMAQLVDHLAAAPTTFAKMMRGEEIDWSAPPPHVGSERADAFRRGAQELLDTWRGAGDDAAASAAWQCAEIAVHSYDLATALGRPTADLDPVVAESGLGFMQASLTLENRGGAFGPEQPAPEGADAYQRIAAFAGRTVTPSR
ncbi:MAG TPA: TIGR03086 family metal-binding protein [Nocardioides sp.]|jgi:uncharacterized protein (TIGR03086 family)|nr:TIGR03086 family metal-binding protein [Nocardioides sp.]